MDITFRGILRTDDPDDMTRLLLGSLDTGWMWCMPYSYFPSDMRYGDYAGALEIWGAYKSLLSLYRGLEDA